MRGNELNLKLQLGSMSKTTLPTFKFTVLLERDRGRGRSRGGEGESERANS